NPPLRVYDTSGPYTDPDVRVDIRQGLPRLREPWIRARAQYVETEPAYRPLSGHSDPDLPLPPRRKALRGSGLVTQMQLARAALITPEMEFVAPRESLGREQPNPPLARVPESPISNLQRERSRRLRGESFGASIPDYITPEFVRDEVARGRAI